MFENLVRRVSPTLQFYCVSSILGREGVFVYFSSHETILTRTAAMAHLHARYAEALVLLAMISSALGQKAAMMCDEAQCTSPSLYMMVPDLKQQNGLYDCWATGTDEPYSCASGYTGQVVPTVPAAGNYKYYTCCKPGFTAAGTEFRTCPHPSILLESLCLCLLCLLFLLRPVQYFAYTLVDYVFMKVDVVQDCDTTTFPTGSTAGSCTSPVDDKGINKDCITCGEQVDSRVNTRAWVDRLAFVLLNAW